MIQKWHFVLLTVLAFAWLAAAEKDPRPVNGIQKVTLEVRGLVCELCAGGVKADLDRLDFLASSRYDLKKETFYLTVKEKAKVDLSRILQRIKLNGFSTGKLWVSGVGKVLVPTTEREKTALVDFENSSLKFEWDLALPGIASRLKVTDSALYKIEAEVKYPAPTKGKWDAAAKQDSPPWNLEVSHWESAVSKKAEPEKPPLQ